MARGRTFQGFFTLEDARLVLKRAAESGGLYGLVDVYPPSTYDVLSLENLTDSEDNSPKMRVLMVRRQPLPSQTPLRELSDNMIHFGLVMIIPSRIARGDFFVNGFMSVGTDPPAVGIDSPLPLFQKLKREFQKMCIYPLPECEEADQFRKYRCSANAVEQLRSGHLPAW